MERAAFPGWLQWTLCSPAEKKKQFFFVLKQIKSQFIACFINLTLKLFLISFFCCYTLSVSALGDDSGAQGAISKQSRLLRAGFSLSVQAGVVLGDAGAPGVLLLGDVGGDQAVGIEPHQADWMSAKQPRARGEGPPARHSQNPSAGKGTALDQTRSDGNQPLPTARGWEPALLAPPAWSTSHIFYPHLVGSSQNTRGGQKIPLESWQSTGCEGWAGLGWLP